MYERERKHVREREGGTCKREREETCLRMRDRQTDRH